MSADEEPGRGDAWFNQLFADYHAAVRAYAARRVPPADVEDTLFCIVLALPLVVTGCGSAWPDWATPVAGTTRSKTRWPNP